MAFDSCYVRLSFGATSGPQKDIPNDATQCFGLRCLFNSAVRVELVSAAGCTWGATSAWRYLEG
jgi:hypothetical protein